MKSLFTALALTAVLAIPAHAPLLSVSAVDAVVEVNTVTVSGSAGITF